MSPFRERYLKFVCSLDVFATIPIKTAYSMFQNNLGKVEMLSYVHAFNLSDSVTQLEFVLGHNDKYQWDVSTFLISFGPIFYEGSLTGRGASNSQEL